MHDPQEISEVSSNLIASERGNSSDLIKSETAIEIRSGETECADFKEISENQSDPVVPETVIEVRSGECECLDAEGGDSKAEGNALENPKEMAEELKVKAPLADHSYSSGELNGEDPNNDKVCRICHLSSDRGPGTLDLIDLGCGCRGELGASHRHCAETWFKLKGNRYQSAILILVFGFPAFEFCMIEMNLVFSNCLKS